MPISNIPSTLELIWSPLTENTIIDEYETAINIHKTISVTVVPPIIPNPLLEYPEKLVWSCDPPLPDQLSITTSGLTLDISSQSLLGLFPISELTYLKPGSNMEYGTVYHWNDLPANATEIVAYKPSLSNVKDYMLTVTTDTGESSKYTIRIKANYDTGKANLQQAVEARRQTNAKYS
jgi:hypothetical protein